MTSPASGGGRPRMPRQPKGYVTQPVVPNPGTGKSKRKVNPTPMPGKGRGFRPLPIDERIVRTMPITEKQLGTIKKMYGI